MQEQYLKLIFEEEYFLIDEVNGTEILADAKYVFADGISSDFKKLGVSDEKGQKTKKTPVDMYKIMKGGNF
jgi:hypothetical protein